MPGRPICEARLRDGTTCKALVFTEDVFCSRHRELAQEFGEEAVRQGSYPRLPRTGRKGSGKPVERNGHAPDVRVAPSGNGNGASSDQLAEVLQDIDPSTVRPMLGQTAAANVEAIRASLLKAATEAERGVFATVECKFCHKEGRYSVQVPDIRSRVAAANLLLEQGLGKVSQAADQTPRVPQSVLEVRRLKWAEVEHLVAGNFLSDVRRVLAIGGEAALQERIAHLPDSTRALLQEALA